MVYEWILRLFDLVKSVSGQEGVGGVGELADKQHKFHYHYIWYPATLELINIKNQFL